MPSYVTMLRLLVSPDPLSNTAFFTSLANSNDNKAAGTGGMGGVEGEDLSVTVLKRDLKRAKWLDDATTDLGLIRYTHTLTLSLFSYFPSSSSFLCTPLFRFPWLGVEKAEIITALCSMLHGPLSKVDNEAFGSVKEVIDSIAANLVFMQYADSIAQLFLDRFR